MTIDLVIVASNPQPKREARYPRTWLLYRQGQGPVKVQVERDNNKTPHMRDKAPAQASALWGAVTNLFSVTPLVQ